MCNRSSGRVKSNRQPINKPSFCLGYDFTNFVTRWLSDYRSRPRTNPSRPTSSRKIRRTRLKIRLVFDLRVWERQIANEDESLFSLKIFSTVRISCELIISKSCSGRIRSFAYKKVYFPYRMGSNSDSFLLGEKKLGSFYKLYGISVRVINHSSVPTICYWHFLSLPPPPPTLLIFCEFSCKNNNSNPCQLYASGVILKLFLKYLANLPFARSVSLLKSKVQRLREKFVEVR